MSEPLKAPFVWFGGKSRAAPLIWEALGNVPNYVEPFAGSLAVLLGRPHAPHTETVNDKDGFICNAWRAIAADPKAVAQHADWPVNEADQHARHAWLVRQRDELTARLMGDPDYYDAKVAGWWLWGINVWIGSGWCSGNGAWQVVEGKLVHLGNTGQGIHRQLVHLGNTGRGIHRQCVHLGDAGQEEESAGLYAWMRALATRLRRVRVCCGDWQRVLGPSVTYKHGLTGIVLDPPYSHAERNPELYAVEEDISAAVCAWALANGDNPLLRIVLCGYSGEHELPGWRRVTWSANGGMGNQRRDTDNQNKWRETLWLSPHCLEQQPSLFGATL